MAPDLSEKLLGIDIDDADDRERRAADDEDEQEERERFVFFRLGDDRFAVHVEDVRTLAEVPEAVTRVPRTPDAIEGMMDLRGEVIAVVDPCVHFPSIDSSEDRRRERLLVLDRPTDEQSVALRVDDVIGVEAIPVSDVLDDSSVEERRLSGDALTHPLVDALIEREQEHRPDDDVSLALETETDAPTSGTDELGAFDESDAGDEPREVVVEGTPLLDVGKLLLASGPQEQRV
ncbi:chemotaxis protein CheW [Natronolimnohabitans sp. A-GB9]|uniref:chemotaxis protein CheW n=1 Tax=Natronolimnohabitans sp. A-GB9 TaxID=3069757 RepID=UPI0027B41F51|nr:chemotaxis protein CheW [Natronolimnohabitans sp. A-GB9]MDQ2051386.1 chemotaxis protein CheW [Natronolimnohabitans sp. A-GB9]